MKRSVYFQDWAWDLLKKRADQHSVSSSICNIVARYDWLTEVHAPHYTDEQLAVLRSALKKPYARPEHLQSIPHEVEAFLKSNRLQMSGLTRMLRGLPPVGLVATIDEVERYWFSPPSGLPGDAA